MKPFLLANCCIKRRKLRYQSLLVCRAIESFKSGQNIQASSKSFRPSMSNLSKMVNLTSHCFVRFSLKLKCKKGDVIVLRCIFKPMTYGVAYI